MDLIEQQLEGFDATARPRDRRALAEALTTHGVALARLGRHAEAHATLRRAAAVAEGAGHLEGAGLAELSLLEELRDRLDPREAYSLYLSADGLLAHTQSRETLARLRAAAQSILATSATDAPAQEEEASESWDGFSLRDVVKQFEEDLIERALRDTGGSVSRAARLLGFRHHESLNWRLKNRNKTLLAARTPARRRRRSIITKRG